MSIEEVYANVNGLADWSPWVPFDAALTEAPKRPGVYLFRLPPSGEIVYVGMAGERAGSKRGPQGLKGRLNIYRRGRGAVSGFGEAALDRALADPEWVEEQLRSLQANGPKRAKVWAREAVAYLSPEVRWTTCSTKQEALALEKQIETILRPYGLWNRLVGGTSAMRPGEEAGASVFETEHLALNGESVPSGQETEDQTTFTLHGYTVDLDVIYREMYSYSQVDPETGERVFNGSKKGVPAVKRLIHDLFGVPVLDNIHPVNHAIRSEVRDRLRALGWATKGPGRSAKYVLHRRL